MRVWLSAYACEPGKGSEPGVGWRWANGLASRVDLTVLTRTANREAIERAVEASAPGDPLRSVTFLYHDLAPWLLWLKRRGLPVMAYYSLWQYSLYRRFRDELREVDVLHHLTFCTLLCPGHWNRIRPAFVIGPVGAPLVAEEYYRVFGAGRFLQRLRGAVIRNFELLPWVRRVFDEAAVIVPANTDTRELLEDRGYHPAGVLLDTGSPDVEPRTGAGREGPPRILYAGALQRRKGLELSLRALAREEAAGQDWQFVVVGDGPDRRRLERLARRLGIAGRVEFRGALTHDATLEEMRRADIFLFTSVRDTSAGVNLEAMACGLPVICINHQGVRDITDDECALRVPPGPVEETIGGLARAVGTLAADPGLRQKLGAAARERAITCFRWEDKFDRMTSHYRVATDRRSSSSSPDRTS